MGCQGIGRAWEVDAHGFCKVIMTLGSSQGCVHSSAPKLLDLQTIIKPTRLREGALWPSSYSPGCSQSSLRAGMLERLLEASGGIADFPYRGFSVVTPKLVSTWGFKM